MCYINVVVDGVMEEREATEKLDELLKTKLGLCGIFHDVNQEKTGKKMVRITFEQMIHDGATARKIVEIIKKQCFSEVSSEPIPQRLHK